MEVLLPTWGDATALLCAPAALPTGLDFTRSFWEKEQHKVPRLMLSGAN